MDSGCRPRPLVRAWSPGRCGRSDEARATHGGIRIETGAGTCEKIGFADFSTTHFQCFTQLITGPDSIFHMFHEPFFFPKDER